MWTYSSGLEKESGRFSEPGEFFTYIIFLGVVILVSRIHLLFCNVDRSSMSVLLYSEPRNICPPSLHLAAAVPGNEEDYPCISRKPIIRNQSLQGPTCGVSMVKAVLRIAYVRI